MTTAFLVLVRVLVNPVSNVFQKQLAQRSANPLFIILATHALLALAALPLTARPATASLSHAFWANITLCSALAVASNTLLVHALKSGDLSVLGPVNAYKSVISLVLAVFLVGERPTLAGLAGIALIVAGSFGILDRPAGTPVHRAWTAFLADRAIQLRLLALVLSATEAVFLKRAVLAADPGSAFAWWATLGVPVACLGLAGPIRHRLRDEFSRLKREWKPYAGLATTTGLMQLTTLHAFTTLQVGYALALFQLSALVSVFLGHHFFREAHLRRRLLGASVMAAGAILIVLAGRQPAP